MVAYVKPGDIINASDYNQMQTRVNNVLGTGSGLYGYGQTLTSAQVAADTIIRASHMQNLKADIDACRKHQINADTYVDVDNITTFSLDDTSINDLILAGDIDENTEEHIVDLSDRSYNDFENAIGQIETDHLLAATQQLEANFNALSSQRTSTWNGTIKHEFTVTFNDSEHRRHFFNTGGQIQVETTIVNYSGSKGTDWYNMLNNSGVIFMDYTNTDNDGTSGTPYALGNSDLTTSYQVLFEKEGSSVYAENRYIVEAKVNIVGAETAQTGKQLQFRVQFQDNDTGDQTGEGAAEDEDVDGTITNYVYELRAKGTSGVEIAAASYATVSGSALSNGG